MARLSLQRIAPLIAAVGLLTTGLLAPAAAKLDPFPGASVERARVVGVSPGEVDLTAHIGEVSGTIRVRVLAP